MITRQGVVSRERNGRPALGSSAVPVRVMLTVVLAAFASRIEAQDVKGRVTGVQVRVVDNATGEVRGELLGLKEESLWILGDGQTQRAFVSVPLAELREIHIQRHGWSGSRIALWTTLAGGATTIAMFGACASLEDSDSCAVVAVGWAGMWAAIGGLTRLLIGPSWKRINPPGLDELRPYARFPQGLPHDYPPRVGVRVPPPDHELR